MDCIIYCLIGASISGRLIFKEMFVFGVKKVANIGRMPARRCRTENSVWLGRTEPAGPSLACQIIVRAGGTPARRGHISRTRPFQWDRCWYWCWCWCCPRASPVPTSHCNSPQLQLFPHNPLCPKKLNFCFIHLISK